MSSNTITYQTNTSTQTTATPRRSGYIAFLKLLALTGVLLDMMFHWLESGNWMGVLAFLIDGVEVENLNLHGSGLAFTAMQVISIVAHAAFLLGLLALLFAPLNRASASPLSGIKQVLDLPFNGRGKWLTYGSVTALVLLGVVLVGLSLKGTGVI